MTSKLSYAKAKKLYAKMPRTLKRSINDTKKMIGSAVEPRACFVSLVEDHSEMRLCITRSCCMYASNEGYRRHGMCRGCRYTFGKTKVIDCGGGWMIQQMTQVNSMEG